MKVLVQIDKTACFKEYVWSMPLCCIKGDIVSIDPLCASQLVRESTGHMVLNANQLTIDYSLVADQYQYRETGKLAS